MNVNALCDVVARQTGAEFADVHLYARRLREAGYLPQGSRGRQAPPIDHRDAATLLVGMFATDIARQAPEKVAAYNELIDRLTHLLREPNEVSKLAVIELSRTTGCTFLYWSGTPTNPNDPRLTEEAPPETPVAWSEFVAPKEMIGDVYAIEVVVHVTGSAIAGVSRALTASGVT